MKNAKKLFYVLFVMLLSTCGLLFGCDNKYKNLKISTNLESDEIVLYYNDLDNSTKTFEITVEGAGNDISTNIKQPNMSVDGIVKVEYDKQGLSNKTTVTLTAIGYGETDLIFVTEEGGKKFNLHVSCEYKLESLVANQNYKAYALVGETIKLNSAKCLEFYPVATTQRDVVYSLVGSYSGVVVDADGTITTDENAQTGSFQVKATSVQNSNISTTLTVSVLKGIQDISVVYNGENSQFVLSQDNGLFLATNMLEESYKILNVEVTPTEHTYTLQYRFLNADKVATSTQNGSGNFYSNTFEGDVIDDSHIAITAKNAGDEYLEVVATIAGYEYKSEPKLFKLHSENIAKNIDIYDAENGSQNSSYIIYDDYNGTDGKPIRVSVGGDGIVQNTQFVIRLKDSTQDASKIQIYTGKRDENGLIPAKLYSQSATSYDVFDNNTVLYIKASANIENIQDTITLEFVACSTMGLIGKETVKSIDFHLRNGVSELLLDGAYLDNTVLVPIKEVVNGKTVVGATEITLKVRSNEYAEYVFTENLNTGYVVEQTTVYYQDYNNVAGYSLFTFSVYGVKNGVYTLTFYTPNGRVLDVKIRVFTKLDTITLTTSTIEQDSDIGELQYQTQDNLKTLDGGKVTVKLGGTINLNFNSYLTDSENEDLKYLRKIDFQTVKFSFCDNADDQEQNTFSNVSQVVKIDNTNQMLGYTVGKTKVKVIIVVWDNEFDFSHTTTYEINFDVEIYVAISEISLNSKNVTIYTKSTLSDFEEDNQTDKQRYGEFTFALKINPQNTQVDETKDIEINLTGSDAKSLSIKEKTYDKLSNVYYVTIDSEQLSLGKTVGYAKMIATVSQFGRTLIQEADITIKDAVKVSSIYDVRKVQNKIEASLTEKVDAPVDLNEYNFDYYIYLDSRDMVNGKILFDLISNIDPVDALNSKLIYTVRQIDDYQDIIKINSNSVQATNAGLAYIDISAVDSYDQSTNSFATQKTILVKVADGLSRRTSLEISSLNDLRKINDNKENLKKFYIVTKNLDFSSQSSFTPIGYIKNSDNTYSLYEFTGVFNGLMSDNYGEKICATISGIKFGNGFEYTGLFAKLSKDAIIENLNLSIYKVDINTQDSIEFGGIAGENSGDIKSVNVSVANAVIQNKSTNANIGGVAGINKGKIYDAYASGDMSINSILTTAEANIGGLAGKNIGEIDGNTNFFNNAEVRDSYNVQISITANGKTNLGGVAGYLNGTIKRVSFDGSLSGNDNVGGIVGKIVGDDDKQHLSNSFASGIAVGNNNIGGLVGYADGVNISNCSINMFDVANPQAHIVGGNYVGGLVGYANNVAITNAYARSYVNSSRTYQNGVGDITVFGGDEFNQTYAGGLVGYAGNVRLEKVYSIQKIVGVDNVKIGGLVGFANGVQIINTYERNIYVAENPANLIVGKESENSTNSANYFYSSNNGEYGLANLSNIDNCEKNVDASWQGFADNENWLKIAGMYPFLKLDDSKLLTVEPPTKIEVISKENGYMIKVTKDYLENIEQDETLQNTYILFRGKNKIIKFSSMFDILVEPQNDMLNVSKQYSLESSDSNIVQIVGKTSNDFRLRLNSTGRVELVISSKMNGDIQTKIVIYVLDAVKDFDIKTVDEQYNNLIVDKRYELVTTTSNSYINNNNFYIKFYNNNNGNLMINNDDSTEKFVKNNEKIYIFAKKSGNYSINYQIYIKLTIQNKDYYIPFGNDNGQGINVLENQELNFDFVYGIKDFVSEVDFIETGLNDVATLKYTLTGDDLRIAIDDKYYLQTPNVSFVENNQPSFESNYWNLVFVYANVYFGDRCEVVYADNFADELAILQNDAVTKIQYIYELVAKENNVQNYFKNNTQASNITSHLKIQTGIKPFESEWQDINIANENAYRETYTEISIKRQKVDNVSLSFYTHAEKQNNGNDEVYNVNEVPSTAIVRGETGMLKIATTPLNAEIKAVTVTYKNQAGYSMSMNQVLKNTDNNSVKYINRLPYAVATENGTGINLYYQESNVEFVDGDSITNFDGYLYVNCLIPSEVPVGQVFTISVEILYTYFAENGDGTEVGNYKYVASIDLVARNKSELKIGYDFNYENENNEIQLIQSLSSFAVIPVDVEKEFYIDFYEIFDVEDVASIREQVSPEKLGLIGVGLSDREILKTGSYARVYYTIQADNYEEISLQATFNKTKDGVQTAYQSNSFVFKPVLYVVNDINIVENSDNTLVVQQGVAKELDVELVVDAKQDLDLDSQIQVLKDTIKTNLSYWFGKKSGENIYSTLEAREKIDETNAYTNELYENYYVEINDGSIVIKVKHFSQTENLYCEVPITYQTVGDVVIPTIITDQNIISNRIGEHIVGFQDIGSSKNVNTQYLRDNVVLKLINDVSNENPIPVGNAESYEKFEEMLSGSENEIMNYALDEDIVLENYTPRNLDYINFNGNGHTITIKSFATENTSNYGLFDTINEYSTVKNVNIVYESLTEDSGKLLDTSDMAISVFNFGGLCVENYGIIYNVSVEADGLEFVGNISRETNISGICCTNNGWISYTKCRVSITTNCGFVAGFASFNTKKISNSKVILTDKIENTLTNADLSLTGGFVARNSGNIFGCYIEGANNDEIVISRSTVGGFVNKNTGTISNSYTNVKIESESYASGFVYENTGIVKSCYSNSVLKENSSAHTPFTGTDENGTLLNLGVVEDCYYIHQSSNENINKANEIAEEIKTVDKSKKSSYKKFVFASENKIDGTWQIKNGLPKLVDADIDILFEQVYQGMEFVNDTMQYTWEFKNSDLSYGKILYNNETPVCFNPKTISSVEEWNEKLLDNIDYCFVILKDLNFDKDDIINTSVIDFEGILLGNNAQMTNMYLRATSEDKNKCYGLFAKIENAVIKDLNLSARQVQSSSANCVGLLAGYVNNSSVVNISIDSSNLDAIQGKNIVGVLAGLVNNSTITKINISGNVNAGYIGQIEGLKNFKIEDIQTLTNNQDEGEIAYSYAGTFAGALVGNTTAKLVAITGENKVSGFYAGSAVGLVAEDATLSLASVEIVDGQYVRAFAFAGGLVGENRGIVDRCYVQHSQDIQNAIDNEIKNKYTTNRNLNFFVGSPQYIGGLVGLNNGGKITNSYSKLDVRANQYTTRAAGGIVGMAVDGEINNCYATGSVANIYINGGLVGIATNYDFLMSYHVDENNPDKEPIRNDRYNTFSNAENGAYISNVNKLTISNSFSSNKWLLLTNVEITDIDYLSMSNTGFIIGLVVENTQRQSMDSLDKNNAVNIDAYDKNNYFNLQILKETNRQEPITINTLQIQDSDKDRDILKAIIGEISGREGLTLAQFINKYSIGAFNSSLDTTASDIRNSNSQSSVDLSKFEIASCVVNDVLIDYENILNKDELLFSKTNGLYVSMNFDAETVWCLNTEKGSSLAYPTIIENLNL